MMKTNRVGVVIIGRNEGVRFQQCLRSVLKETKTVVYVDSGSFDNSVSFAKSLHVDTIILDVSLPFSAARARNEGFKYLVSKYIELEYVQFIDGDCQLYKEWIPAAVKFLDNSLLYAIASGRLREKYPEKTIYNLLCDIEWDTPIGDTIYCGGIFMMRVTAFNEVEGFNPSVIAGEEPDLCHRLCQKGWNIRRLEIDMALHDADMFRFSQWWRRSKRTGYAYAHGFFLHINDRTGYFRREVTKTWIWAFIIPLCILSFTIFVRPFFCFLLLLYPLRFFRIAKVKYKKKHDMRRAIVYGFFTVLASWPQLFGQIKFIKTMLLRSKATIIEYK